VLTSLAHQLGDEKMLILLVVGDSATEEHGETIGDFEFQLVQTVCYF
jgi:hypothetical protein